MDNQSDSSNESIDRKPTILRLESKSLRGKEKQKKDWESTNEERVLFPRLENIIAFDDEDLWLSINERSFIPNQNVELNDEDGYLCVTINQTHSTPGVICKQKIKLPMGLYEMSVFGHSDFENTFFPWARNVETRVRVSETTHITRSDEPDTIPLIIDSPMTIEIGVLSHNTQIGDKCWLKAITISKSKLHRTTSSNGRFTSITSDQYRPWGKTELEEIDDGLLVTSKPIKTPGTYADIKVTGGEIISLKFTISIAYPSVAFVYVADSISGKELAKRTNVFRSSENVDINEYPT